MSTSCCSDLIQFPCSTIVSQRFYRFQPVGSEIPKKRSRKTPEARLGNRNKSMKKLAAVRVEGIPQLVPSETGSMSDSTMETGLLELHGLQASLKSRGILLC